MTIDQLPRYIETQPATPRACDRCCAFKPEIVLESTVVIAGRDCSLTHALCWFCAHDVLEHGAKLGELRPDLRPCHCPRRAFYPAPVLELLALAAAVHVDRGEASERP